MFSENFEISDKCPLCLEGDLKFIHINLEEDVKMCMNEQCVYPFEFGVIDEFVPSKTKSEKGSRSYESLATVMSKLEKEYQKDCLEWDRFADGNEFLSNIDQKAACEYVDKLNALAIKEEVDTGDANGDCRDFLKFLESLGESPKTSVSGTVCEDPVISKLIQSHIDTGETEVNRSDNDEEFINSVINELKETQGEGNENIQLDMQWDAEDFNSETLEMNDSVQKNEVISHSEDHDLNVIAVAEKGDGGVVTGESKAASPGEPDRSYHTEATEDQLQNDVIMDSAMSKEKTDDTTFENIHPPLADHTYYFSNITANESEILKAQNDPNVFYINTASEQEDTVIIEEYEEVVSLSDQDDVSMHCSSPYLRANSAAVDSEISKNLNINGNSEQGISDINTWKEGIPLTSDLINNSVDSASASVNSNSIVVNNGIPKHLNVSVNSGQDVSINTGKHKDPPLVIDFNSSVHSTSASVNSNSTAFETMKDLSRIDPYGKTIIVRCTENIPLHLQIGSKYLKSYCVIQPPRTKDNQSSDNSQVMHMFPNIGLTLPNTEEQNGLKESVAQTSAQSSNKPNGTAFSHPSTNSYTSFLSPNKGVPSSLETAAASVEQTPTQLIDKPMKPNSTGFSHPSTNGYTSSLETAAASVEQTPTQLIDKPKKPNSTGFGHPPTNSYTSSLTPNKGVRSSLEAVAASLEQLNNNSKKPSAGAPARTAACIQTSCTSEKSNVNAKGSMDKFTRLFSKSNTSNFAKFDFPDFDKTEHKIPWKEMPRTFSRLTKNKIGAPSLKKSTS